MAQAWRTPLAISRPKTLTLAMCDCDSCRMYGNQCACKGDCGDPQCRALDQDALGQCDWTKCRGHIKKHPAEQFCKKCWKSRWPQEWGIPVAILPPPPPPPPPPAPVGKGGGILPPPGLGARPNPAPAGKGPLFSPLADALQRLALLETAASAHDVVHTQIHFQANQIMMLERQNKDMADQIMLHDHQMTKLENRIDALPDRHAIENRETHPDQMTKLENRIDALEAAANTPSASASVSSATGSFEVLKNPSLL